MALITTYRHFVGIIDLPNTSPNTPTGEVLADQITKYEEVYLRRILGHALYTLFQANLSQGSGIYHDLKTGATYTDRQGLTAQWDGFNTIGKNPIANYIYVQYQSQQFSASVGVGERRPQSENMTMSNPAYKMVRAWNEMVDFNANLHEFLYANQSSYPDYIGLTFPPMGRIPMGCTQVERQFQNLFITMNPYGI